MNTMRSEPVRHKSYEIWDEDKTPFRAMLRLDAASYRPNPLFDIAAVLPDEPVFLVSPQGSFAYQNRLLPKGQTLRVWRKNGRVYHEGRVVWNGDVAFPSLIDLNINARTEQRFTTNTPVDERVSWGSVWMSLTPMEMLTQRGGIQFATKTVVLGGLGLGWLLRKVCEKAEVERVVVVERSRELLDWYGLQLCRRYAKVVDVICDDIYNQMDKHGPTARYVLDIWMRYGGAANDHRLTSLRRKMKRRIWAWGLDS
jgi:hypothetical protein